MILDLLEIGVFQRTSHSLKPHSSLVRDYYTLISTLHRNGVVSVFSGSFPASFTLNSSNGVISGILSQKRSSQSVTINTQSNLASQKIVLTFTVIIPLSSFSYPQSTYIIPRNHSFSSSPIITGDTPFYSIESGELPSDLTLNSDSGIILISFSIHHNSECDYQNRESSQ